MSRKWSIQALSDMKTTSETARSVLQTLVDLLDLQTEKIDALLKRDAGHETRKNLRHLRYVYQDTAKLCRNPLNGGILLDRWNEVDQSTISSILAQVRDRHAPGLERWLNLVDPLSLNEMDERAILESRCGVQLLTNHYVQLHQQQQQTTASEGTGPSASSFGSVSNNIEPIVNDAVAEVQHVCEAHWLACPEVIVPRMSTASDFLFIRPWLQYTLVEVLKNACHATMQQAKHFGGEVVPIRLHISQTNTMTTVDVVDSGIGFGPIESPNDSLFRLGHSSAGKRWDRLDEQQSYAAVRSPMSSLGVGLPVSRSMCQYFGGNLFLFPTPESMGATAKIELR